MSHRRIQALLPTAAILFALFNLPTAHADVLLHLSDDTEVPVSDSEMAEANAERKIIYRVICPPDGERLPDCDQVVTDVEQIEGDKAAVKTTPSFPSDPENAANTPVKPPVSHLGAPSGNKKTSGKAATKTKANNRKNAEKVRKASKTGKASKTSKPAKTGKAAKTSKPAKQTRK